MCGPSRVLACREESLRVVIERLGLKYLVAGIDERDVGMEVEQLEARAIERQRVDVETGCPGRDIEGQ